MLAILTIAALIPAAAQEFASVEGTVTNAATGLGVRGTTVLLYSTDGSGLSHSSASDAAGKFALGGLQPGGYILRASHDGFLTTPFTALSILRSPSGGLPAPSRVALKLVSAATISGRVLNESGEPVPGAEVHAARWVFRAPAQPSYAWPPARTNDRGEFEIAGLPPGLYFVAGAVRRSDWRYAGDNSIAGQAFAPSYYPGVLEQNQATSLEVRAGDVLRGIDIVIRERPTRSVKGRVSGIAAPAAALVSLLPLSRAGLIAMGCPFAEVYPDGSFEARGLHAGRYEIVAQSHETVPEWSARSEVDLSTGDISNVILALRPRFAVTGIVRVEGSSGSVPRGMSVGFLELQRIGSPPSPSAKIEPNGRFTLPGVTATRRQIRLSGIPAGHYVKSVRVNGVPTLKDIAEVDSPCEVEFWISPGGARIEGTVIGTEDRPVGQATVHLFRGGDDHSLSWVRETGAPGRFHFEDLTLGDYEIIATRDCEPGDEDSPSFAKLYSRLAEKVTLGEKSVAVKLLRAAACSPY